MAAPQWTFTPQADNATYIQVLRYLAEMWDCICGRNFYWNVPTLTQYSLDYGPGWIYPAEGSAVGCHVFRLFQDVVANNYQQFLQLENGEPLDYTAIPDRANWHWTFTTFKAAIGTNDSATTIGGLFRRFTDKPLAEGGTVQYGVAQPGDIVGPWLWEDLNKAMKLLYVLPVPMPTSPYRYDVRCFGTMKTGYSYDSSWTTAYADASTNYGASNNPNYFTYPSAFTLGTWDGSTYSAQLFRVQYSFMFYVGWDVAALALFQLELPATFKVFMKPGKVGPGLVYSPVENVFDDMGDGLTEGQWKVLQTTDIADILDETTDAYPYRTWTADAAGQLATPADRGAPTVASRVVGWQAEEFALIIIVDFGYKNV